MNERSRFEAFGKSGPGLPCSASVCVSRPLMLLMGGLVALALSARVPGGLGLLSAIWSPFWSLSHTFQQVLGVGFSAFREAFGTVSAAPASCLRKLLVPLNLTPV